MSKNIPSCVCISDKYVYQAKYGGILLSAMLVHSSMSEAHIAMCNSLNKVHSYLAHPLVAPVQVGMRASGDFFHQYSPSLYRLLLLKPPEYNHTFFVICILFKSCIIILFMLLLICLHYLDFSVQKYRKKYKSMNI